MSDIGKTNSFDTQLRQLQTNLKNKKISPQEFDARYHELQVTFGKDTTITSKGAQKYPSPPVGEAALKKALKKFKADSHGRDVTYTGKPAQKPTSQPGSGEIGQGQIASQEFIQDRTQGSQGSGVSHFAEQRQRLRDDYIAGKKSTEEFAAEMQKLNRHQGLHTSFTAGDITHAELTAGLQEIGISTSHVGGNIPVSSPLFMEPETTQPIVKGPVPKGMGIIERHNLESLQLLNNYIHKGERMSLLDH